MTFHIVRIEVSKKKEPLNLMALPDRFTVVEEAEGYIRSMVVPYAKHGENRKAGYWWYEDKNQRYWLIVKDDNE
jgi:hypothetical protein